MTNPSKQNRATGSLSLLEQVQARRDELQAVLEVPTTSKSTRADIEAALASISPMLTGDLAKLPDMVRRDLSRWIEAHKYLGVRAGADRGDQATTAPASDVAASAAPVAAKS